MVVTATETGLDAGRKFFSQILEATEGQSGLVEPEHDAPKIAEVVLVVS